MVNKVLQALYSHFHGTDSANRFQGEKAGMDKNIVERFFVARMEVYPGKAPRSSNTQDDDQIIGIPRMQYMILPRAEYPLPHPLTFNSREAAKNWIIRQEGDYDL